MPRVIFEYNGAKTTIQCLKEDTMKNICLKYSSKINTNINSLYFLYGGNQINPNLSFEEQANSIDRGKHEMNVLVYQLEKEGLICPKSGENIQLDTKLIDDIWLSNNDINDYLIWIKGQIEKIIICITNKQSIDSIKIQLKNINLILNNAIENLKKNNETLNKLKNINKEFTKVFNKKKITKKEDKAQFFDKIENLTNSEKIQAHSSYISNIILLQNDKIATSSLDQYIKIFNKDAFEEALSLILLIN